MGYFQDDYDKWFISVINYLIATRNKHKKFKSQQDLSKILGFTSDENVSAIKRGARGVPKDMRNSINKILKQEFGITRLSNISLQLEEPAAVYNIDKRGTQLLNAELNMLKENNGYLKNLLEQYLKDIKVNSDTTLVNQQIMMAHISADSTLAAVRYVGDDPERLSAELRKRDKLIGVALEKAS